MSSLSNQTESGSVPRPQMERKSFDDAVLSVSELTHALKRRLEREFPTIRVQGEVSNFRRQASGHCYFSLKDDQAQISAVLFRGAASRLDRLPKEGDAVTISGQLNVYVPRGQVQLIVRSLQYSGIGALLLRLETLKNELKARGWLDASIKQRLPPFPKRIGVVTSPTGAALQDMLNVLNRRQGAFNLLLNPVRVQGKEAAAEIAQAIDDLNAHKLVDVMIIGRGGGSIEDLWPFNEEVVARAVHQSVIPIISAVGHETDWTLSDFVADVRAPTPSAAAELVMAERNAHIEWLHSAQERMIHTLRHLVAQGKARLSRFESHPLFTSPYHLLGRLMQQCDALRLQFDQTFQRIIEKKRHAIESITHAIHAASPGRRIQQDRERLLALTKHLRSLNPKNLLSKGYTLLFAQKGGAVVSSIKQLENAKHVHALLADGQALLTIDSVEKPCD